MYLTTCISIFTKIYYLNWCFCTPANDAMMSNVLSMIVQIFHWTSILQSGNTTPKIQRAHLSANVLPHVRRSHRIAVGDYVITWHWTTMARHQWWSRQPVAERFDWYICCFQWSSKPSFYSTSTFVSIFFQHPRFGTSHDNKVCMDLKRVTSSFQQCVNEKLGCLYCSHYAPI